MLFLSYKTRQQLRQNFQQLPLGFAHYSYGHIKEKFSEMFFENNISVTEITYPEIYPDYSALTKKKPAHLIIKPFDEIRILKRAMNIGHIMWEFEKIPTRSDWPVGHPYRRKPFLDYVRMAKTLDKICVSSNYSKNVFHQHGFDNVFIIPAPIKPFYPKIDMSFNRKAAIIGKMTGIELYSSKKTADRNGGLTNKSFTIQSILKPDSKIYLTVANPNDIRKNLPTLVKAFAKHSQNGNYKLIIKLNIDNEAITLREVVNSILPSRFEELEISDTSYESENILFLAQFLSREEMNQLYQFADFYLCTSFAEGQNLPLLEAMALGVVPVSVCNTAMLDYINDTNSIVIKTNSESIPHILSLSHGLMGIQWSTCNIVDVMSALDKSSKLPPEHFLTLSQNAVKTIAEKFSYAKVFTDFRKIISA